MELASDTASIVQKAQAGDRDAFRVLYQLLAPKVFRFIRPRARSRAEALDVLQETFIDFWKGLSSFSYQGDAALISLMYVIASRKQSRMIRWWKRSDSLETIADVVVDERADQHMHGVSLDIARALQTLRHSDREILTLRTIEGRSFSDIAVLLGEHENTVKVRHHRALIRLRAHIRYE